MRARACDDSSKGRRLAQSIEPCGFKSSSSSASAEHTGLKEVGT
jgi:hypothetical protein